jgi:hypothetical protein
MHNKGFILPGVLFLGFYLIYFFGSFSRIPFGDCIGFVADTEKGDFIMSTSTYAHFLFTNSLVLMKKIFPFVGSSEIGRFLVITSSCVSLVLLYKTVLTLTRDYFSSFFSAVIFGLSFTFWRNSEIIEIYTFNLVWIALFLLFALKFLLTQKGTPLLLASLFLGISLFSHIQNILMVPALLLLLIWGRDQRTSLSSLLIFAFSVLALISVPLLKGEPVAGVFSTGTVLDTFQFAAVIKSFAAAVGYIFYNFWYFVLFSVLGLIHMYKNHYRIFLFFISAAVPVFLFSVIFSVSDNYVFFIPFNFILAILCGVGIFMMKDRKSVRILSFTSLLVPFFYWISLQAVSTTAKGKSFGESKAYKGGLPYYMLPWMKNNVGILEFTIDGRTARDRMEWMTKSAEEFIRLKKAQGYSLEEIRKL